MQTIDEVREHCRYVGKGIEKAVAAGMELVKARSVGAINGPQSNR